MEAAGWRKLEALCLQQEKCWVADGWVLWGVSNAALCIGVSGGKEECSNFTTNERSGSFSARGWRWHGHTRGQARNPHPPCRLILEIDECEGIGETLSLQGDQNALTEWAVPVDLIWSISFHENLNGGGRLVSSSHCPG